MTLKTRPLTGLDPWPFALVTGVQKSGKTHIAAEASASPLIGRTFWFTQGEDAPDGFLNIPTKYGAPRVEVALYDGTYRGLYGAMLEARGEATVDGKPNLWVLDSGTKFWNLLTDMAQDQANKRWAKRDANKNKEIPEDGITISTDLWTTAKDRWKSVIDMMRLNPGPSIITARLENVNVVNAKGDPTGEKIWKIQAEKNLAYEVDAIVELRDRGETYITGVRSSRYHADPKAVTRFPDFTMDEFWRKLGFADNAAGIREHVTSTGPESQARDELVIAQRRELLGALRELATKYRVTAAAIGREWTKAHGHPIEQTSDIGSLELFVDDCRTRFQQMTTQKDVA